MFGFHGTGIDNATKIMNNGFTIAKSNKVPNDLGTGVYFYINSAFTFSPIMMAKNYSIVYKRISKAKITVLQAEIDEEATLIDFDLKSNLIELVKYRDANFDKIKNILNTVEKGNGLAARGNLDGIVIELFKTYLEEKYNVRVDGVKKNTFTPQHDLYKYKQSNMPNGRELCVYNLNRISNLKICE
ncbi:hypothetical protein LOOC260_102170 [Paucilactobacillus hokkaidonensis JCM 18461]|uniref:PARP catalytic domain-containing protein n=2 Tax=Paucilactobacillus hokkaidonensis TaxID=1193095 RepID=A0A0A1GS22_9LACO|nr:hypothetical protein [Paucilactobacillus hokkaidonensis]BAP84795.1 hypothetical protein LOOC260_102170 [Paucilactobacillus hokkaidonensis JCM 18461]